MQHTVPTSSRVIHMNACSTQFMECISRSTRTRSRTDNLDHDPALLQKILIKVGGSLYPAALVGPPKLPNSCCRDRTLRQPTYPDTSWPARTVAPALRYDARWQAGRMVFPWPLQPQPQRLVLCSLTRSVGSSYRCNGAAGENCAQGCNNSASASGQGGAKPSPRR